MRVLRSKSFLVSTLLLQCLFGISCSTLSQSLETPMVLKPKSWSVGVGASFLHDFDQNENIESRSNEFAPTGFLGGRYGLVRNTEVSVSTGTLGLTLGTAAEARFRWTWIGGWKTESQMKRRNQKKIKRINPKERQPSSVAQDKELDEDDELDEEDLEGLEESFYMVDGWISTLSVGGLWSGYNDVQDYSVGSHTSGFFVSNTVGWKKKKWIYYFGIKAMQIHFDYEFKMERTQATFDILKPFDSLLLGGFLGTTYTWGGKRGNAYQWDVLLSFNQLPRNSGDRSLEFYPGITMSFWYID